MLGRDLKIYERPSELAAYRASRLQVFLLPGQARAAELVDLVEANLAQVCAIASTREPGTWRLTDRGPRPFEITEKRSSAGRRRSGRQQISLKARLASAPTGPAGPEPPALGPDLSLHGTLDPDERRVRLGYRNLS